jgi:hypothetical protein
MIMRRVWAMPNKWTFEVKPIMELIRKYAKDGKNWIDPFAGMNSPAELTNDLNEDMPTKYHKDAITFCKELKDKQFDGILFDPPYSLRQIREAYRGAGLSYAKITINAQFYNNVRKVAHTIVKPGGYAINFGWHSNGFGKRFGFKIVEILLVAHGGAHYDTICTVEKKMNKTITTY